MLPAAGAAVLIGAAPIVAPIFVAGGLLVGGAAALFGAYKALWPTSREKADGKKIEKLEELDNKYWSCHIHRVGVIGIKRSGKTEIKTQLRALGTGERDTKQIETHILHADKDIFIALIDGQGAEPQERDQQFEIADQSDVLVIVLDHNDSDVSCNIDGDRRGAHDTFLQQLQDRFKAREVRGDKKKLRVIFVLNKKDLWSQAKDSEFTSWFQTHVQGWSGTGISVGEASMEMSAAEEPGAIEELKRKIIAAARQLKK